MDSTTGQPVSVYCDGKGCLVLCQDDLQHGIPVWQHIGQSTTAPSMHCRDMTSDVKPQQTNKYIITTIDILLFFASIDKVPKITSPVLVIHGTEDEVIDFSHGLAIYERCPRTVEPLWVEGAGHNDVELYGQYLERLKQFISVELAVN